MTPEQLKALQASMLHTRFKRDFRHPIIRLFLCLWIGIFVPKKYWPIAKTMRHRMKRDFKRNVQDAYHSIKCIPKGHKIGTYKMQRWCKNCHQIFPKEA